MNKATATASQQVVELNRAGVSFLAVGDASNAFRAFKGAVALMGGIIESHVVADNDCKANACPSIEVASLEDSYFCFYVFNRAFHVDLSTSANLTWANACLLFNLALTFHQRGKVYGEADKLQKALNLYELVLQIVSNVNSSSFAVLAMAVLNNAAAIKYYLGDYAKATELLQSIGQFANVDPQVAVDGPFKPTDLEEIFLNVAIMQPPTTAPSA